MLPIENDPSVSWSSKYKFRSSQINSCPLSHMIGNGVSFVQHLDINTVGDDIGRSQ